MKTDAPTYQELMETVRDLTAENGRLALQNMQLLAECQHYRRKPWAMRGELRLIQKAYHNACILIAWHLAGLNTSRAACAAEGMSHRQWHNAVALLRLARVYDKTFTTNDPAELQTALDRARDAALAAPGRWRARLTKR